MSSTHKDACLPTVDPVHLLGRKMAGNKYRLDELLGCGAFGTTYLAEHLAGEDLPLRSLAVKILGLWRPAGWCARVALNEARLAMAVFDQASDWQEIMHLVPMWDAGTEHVSEKCEIVYLVFPFVHGSTLSRLLGRDKLIEENRLVRWMTHLAAALAVLHSCRPCILHRDVKPDNVFVTSSDVIRLGDLGLASIVRPTLSTAPAAGAMAYQSPEELLLEQCTPASDVYSAGLVFYEMATGQSPLITSDLPNLARGGSQKENSRSTHIEARRQLHARERLEQARPDLSEPILEVISRCLTWLPSQRFRDGVHLYQEMLAIADQKRVNVSSRLAQQAPRAAPQPIVDNVEVAYIRSLIEIGQVSKAVSAARELVNKRPRDIEANLALAHALERQGKGREALQLLQELDSQLTRSHAGKLRVWERIVQVARELGYEAVVKKYSAMLEQARRTTTDG